MADSGTPISYRPATAADRSLTEMLARIQGKSVGAYVRDSMAELNASLVHALGGVQAVVEMAKRMREEAADAEAEAVLSMSKDLAHAGDPG